MSRCERIVDFCHLALTFFDYNKIFISDEVHEQVKDQFLCWDLDVVVVVVGLTIHSECTLVLGYVFLLALLLLSAPPPPCPSLSLSVQCSLTNVVTGKDIEQASQLYIPH